MPEKKSDNNLDQSPLYYYVCEHRASNDPCPKGCFSTPRGQPDPQPVSADWLATQAPPGRGLSDEFNVGS